MTNPGIQMNNLFADSQIILKKYEDYLQTAVYKLTQIAKNYNFKISANKMKTVVFRVKFPVRTKIVIDNEPIEQVSHFTYLGCVVTWNTNKYITMKLSKFRHVCGT